MNIIEKIVLNEPLDDIVTVFALIKAPPHLDLMISCYKPESIRHGELQRSYAKLFHEGVLVEGEKGLAARGPNWKAPSFVTEKRYD
ncbi:hypothetical protein ICA16_20720 [Pseudomonas anatoliensis]|uniref:hypothetical protein n=1 Tax=Pseudomonas anatoliensis TaxID=2710589 RepID=UPI001B33FAE5|nr:hypothetical protein [Pseudomonas anatoliensis]MBP5958104.1 hypothetical protein [Pseudomonas anatoliensis]